ncbi:hypothetical protein LTR53_019162, partial [Teratosphaeriaceae sp. CCFEE 6253]
MVRSRATDSAAQQRADVYRDLIVEDGNKENRPAQHDVPRTDSAVTTRSTTSTFVTVKSWDPRPVNSAAASRTYAHVTTTSSSSSSSVMNRGRPGERDRGPPSAMYIPYSPLQASAAEKSRALSLAQLSGEGTNNSSTTSLGSHTSTSRPANGSTDSL